MQNSYVVPEKIQLFLSHSGWPRLVLPATRENDPIRSCTSSKFALPAPRYRKAAALYVHACLRPVPGEHLCHSRVGAHITFSSSAHIMVVIFVLGQNIRTGGENQHSSRLVTRTIHLLMSNGQAYCACFTSELS